MAEPVARVRQVGNVEDFRVSYDSSTGEICANCDIFRRDVEGLEADIRKKNRKIKELEADQERKAERSEFWAVAQQLFLHWQAVTGKHRSPWSHARFWEIEPYLRIKKFGPRGCQRAIDGRAYQSWVSVRSNGTVAWHVDWARIWQSPSDVEEAMNRAPKGWSIAYSLEMQSWPKKKPTAEQAGGWFGVRPPEGWKPPATQTAAGQGTLLGVVE